jgi:type IV secretion system protein VirD4
LNQYPIVIGRDGAEILRQEGTEHVALHARTRSGKTVGFTIPNLFEWPGSAIVLDIKGEVFKATAGHRARNLGQAVYVFDPTNRRGRSHCWNALDAIDRTSIDRFDQIQRASYTMFPEGSGNSNSERFWEPAGRAAMIAVATLIAETPEEPFTLGHLLHLFSRGDYHERLERMISERRWKGPRYSRLAVEGISDFLSGHSDMVESIRKTITTRLQSWQNPRVAAATGRSDFDLRDFRRRPMTLYITVAPGNIARLRPLLRLLIEQFINLNTDTTPEEDPSLNIPVLLMLDEVARLHRMEIVAESFQFVAAYGIRIAIVVQNKAQIKNLYGANSATDIFDNLGCEIIFGTNDLELATELEKRMGDNTQLFDAQNRPRILAWLKLSKQTVTRSPHRRPLALVQEILRMNPELQFILRAGMKPGFSERIFWPTDDRYFKLVCDPPDIPELVIDIPLDDGSIVIPSRGYLPDSPPEPPRKPRAPRKSRAKEKT